MKRRNTCRWSNCAQSPQCGFASTEEGNPLTEDAAMAKLDRCVEVAREVWGGGVAAGAGALPRTPAGLRPAPAKGRRPLEPTFFWLRQQPSNTGSLRLWAADAAKKVMGSRGRVPLQVQGGAVARRRAPTWPFLPRRPVRPSCRWPPPGPGAGGRGISAMKSVPFTLAWPSA